MKKTIMLFVGMCMIGVISLRAQTQVITLNHNGATSVYYGPSSFTDAYYAATSGDTMVLSAGTFSSEIYLQKRLTIYGAGIFSDSMNNVTNLSNVYFYVGSDSSYIEGVKANYIDIWANAVRVVRCAPSYTVFEQPNISNNSIIEACLLNGYVDLNGNTGVVLRNNYFTTGYWNYMVYRAVNDVFDHNTFNVNMYPFYTFYQVSACYFVNNVINSYSRFSDVFSNVYESIFEKNLLNEASSSGITYSDTTLNGLTFLKNYYFNNLNPIFNTINGDLYTFSESNNYHIVNPQLYTTTDSTEVGMFGGVNPFKPFAIPSHPRVFSKSVSSHTNANGKLQVNIKSKAQDY